MTSKRELADKLDELQEQLKQQRPTKYVAVTPLKGDITVKTTHPYTGNTSRSIVDKADKTIVLYSRNGEPDTFIIDGKWTITQIREAAA